MNICILDDSLVIVEALLEILKKITNDRDNINICGYTEHQSFLKDFKSKKCDILFMDIKLGEINGIDFIKENVDNLKNTKLIYITGYDEYIEEVFETDFVYLIRKPLNEEKVYKAYMKAIKKIENDNKIIVVGL